jgi:hypothetical protein
MLFKMPVAMLGALLGALAMGFWVVRRNWEEWRELGWTLACVLVPFVFYVASVMLANLNIGIRHLLPAYPYIYVAAGILIAMAIRRWHKPVMIVASILGLVLLTESLIAWPNYIAYFSLPFNGPRGGFRLLSDSNLDWGQDLPLLAQWQKAHPDVPLAFGPNFSYQPQGSYFGSVDPAFYGIKSDPLLIKVGLKPEIMRTHILAVSATMVQGTYNTTFVPLQNFTPIEVLGGTIYLYDLRDQK